MKKQVILIFVIILINTFTFCQDPDALLEEANEKMQSGQLGLADSLLQLSIKADPSFAPAYVGFSELWLRKGDLTKSAESATRAVQMDEDFRPWWDSLNDIRNNIQNGRRYIQEGQYEKATNEYSIISDKFPYFPEAQFYIGLTKFRQKDIKSAAFHFSEALKIYPGHIKARKGLNNVTKQFLNNGNQAYKRGDLEKALVYYQDAVSYDNQFYLAFYQLGVLEKKMGNSDMAITYLNKVINIKPDFQKAWFTLGTSYEADNNLDSAINKYNRAIELDSNYTKAYGNLGNIYISKTKYELAINVLNKAISIDPEYADGYLRLGVAYNEQEKFQEASEQFKMATIYNEKNFDAWFRYASSLNAMENYIDASMAAQKCIDIKSKFGGGWYEKGVAEMGKGNRTRALKYFDESNKYRDWRKLAQRKIDEINNPTKYQK